MMATIPDYNELLARFAELEKDCIPGSDAKPYFVHIQESHPYWTNRLREATFALDSEDFDTGRIAVIARLHVGKATSNMKGVTEARMYEYLALVRRYFNLRNDEREWLMSDKYPEAWEYGSPEGIRLTDAFVIAEPAGGVGAGASADREFMVDFVFEVPDHIAIDDDE